MRIKMSVTFELHKTVFAIVVVSPTDRDQNIHYFLHRLFLLYFLFSRYINDCYVHMLGIFCSDWRVRFH
jgi:hypothetical protein